MTASIRLLGLLALLTITLPALGADKLVLVSGVTGKQGGAVARALVEAGYQVRGLTRNPASDRAQALVALGVEVVKGDFEDVASLDAALAGAYGAFSVQTWRGPDGVAGEARQGKVFADAAKRAGVKHFVYTSVASAQRNTGVPHFDSKFEVEQHIRAIGLPHTILRPVAFMENFEWLREEIGNGTFRSVLGPAIASQLIAVRDIGRFAAIAFEAPARWLGEAIEIAGDDLNQTELAATFARVMQTPVAFAQTPWAKFEQNADEEIVTMLAWMRDTGYAVDVKALRAEYPWMLTLEDYLREAGW